MAKISDSNNKNVTRGGGGEGGKTEKGNNGCFNSELEGPKKTKTCTLAAILIGLNVHRKSVKITTLKFRISSNNLYLLKFSQNRLLSLKITKRSNGPIISL